LEQVHGAIERWPEFATTAAVESSNVEKIGRTLRTTGF